MHFRWSMNLLTIQNAKTTKGEKLGFITGIMYLAPHTQSGKNVCAFASKGCAKACLYTAGRGIYKKIQQARINKTKQFFNSPKDFIEILASDIHTLIRKCEREKMLPAVRLNGTSDLPWENFGGNFGVSLMERFPKVQFYDYTKNPNRMKAYLKGNFPSNYHLTFSRSEVNNLVCEEILKMGGNVAYVFDVRKSQPLPKTYLGFNVVDGDEHDLRFLDKNNSILGLRGKGRAKNDKTNFVIKL